MKKVKFALASFAFAAAIIGAVNTSSIAGPQDNCATLPPSKDCDIEVTATCCSYFVNNVPVDTRDGELYDIQ
jgi:hypothetical protein